MLDELAPPLEKPESSARPTRTCTSVPPPPAEKALVQLAAQCLAQVRAGSRGFRRRNDRRRRAVRSIRVATRCWCRASAMRRSRACGRGRAASGITGWSCLRIRPSASGA